jgi:hypothetical protein
VPCIAPRYWIDYTTGDGEATDEFAYVAAQFQAGNVRHVSDREIGSLIVYNGKAVSGSDLGSALSAEAA